MLLKTGKFLPRCALTLKPNPQYMAICRFVDQAREDAVQAMNGLMAKYPELKWEGTIHIGIEVPDFASDVSRASITRSEGDPLDKNFDRNWRKVGQVLIRPRRMIATVYNKLFKGVVP